MIDAKKCWRQKVVAEMTTAHLEQFAREVGTTIAREDALTFLNLNGRAYEMWREMMRAGEEYIKSELLRSRRDAVGLHIASVSSRDLRPH